jgi:A/G-specific adenine glycosylase
MQECKVQDFTEALLDWFHANKRDLPWRRDYSPYVVWISEIMLQQTQVKTALPYFKRWMERFPDVASVGRASSEEVLKYWEGMGYYSRAENIRKTARIVTEELGGEFPRTYGELLRLPGIGPYTAGAIMSFAYNEVCPVVDVNIERVLIRIFNIEGRPNDSKVRKLVIKKSRELIPEGRSRLFNQTLMEHGATVCTALKPKCPQCPVNFCCESFRLGIVDQRPLPGKRKQITPLEVALGVLAHGGRILIQKRPSSGLLPGLWEFPGGKLNDGETPEEALEREFYEELELKIHPVEKLAVIRHNYTTFKVTLHAFLCRLRDEAQEPSPVLRSAVEARWALPDELDHYAFPSANRRLIKLLMKRDWR